MIKSWQHKGLKQFYDTGNTKGIQTNHATRLTMILQRLDAAVKPDDLCLPGMRFHQLKGKRKGFYSVSVNGNWRVIYTFKQGHALLVDYLDYH